MPNLLLFCLDQLAAQALPAWGGTASTPAIDGLIARGARFAEASTTCPLCMPARASFWSGLLPHQTGVLHNGSRIDEVPQNAQVSAPVPTIGSVLSAAGYRCVHVGKTHDAGALHGFEVWPEAEEDTLAPGWAPANWDTFRDVYTVHDAERFLAEPGEAPWCLAVDVLNPHNICGWVGENHTPKRTPEPPFLPELPPNFTVEDWHSRPTSVRHICCAHRRQAQASDWQPRDWQRYIAAYHYYVSLADAAVGRVLASLEQRGLAEDTTIVLWADHGDGMACHRQATKHTSFYQQTVRVPLVLAGAGIPAGRTVTAPVDLLDLLPTVAELGGASAPEGLLGRSLVAAAQGTGELVERPLLSQWHTEWGYTVEPGRMHRRGDLKYCAFREGFEDGHGEELYNLAEDPWETRNLAVLPEYADLLAQERAAFLATLAATDDPFLDLATRIAPEWRRHESGYHHHQGRAAPTH